MEKQKTIQNAQLTEGTQILIRGNVVYSRITSHIEGEELEKDKIRRKNNQPPQRPIDKPYTTITITNARIEPMTQGQFTVEEQYLHERIYDSKKNPDMKNNYTSISKSPFLPNIAIVRNGDPNNADQIVPQGELDRGLDVTLVLRVFASNGNKGLSLDAVLVNEPIRYYTASRGYIGEIAKRGIIINPLTPDQIKEQTERVKHAIDHMPMENNETPYEQVSSAPAGAAMFSANTANAQPQPTQYQQPQQANTGTFGMNQPTPASNDTWTCACGQINNGSQKFCGGCGHPKPEPQAQTQTPPPAQTQPDSPWVCECGMNNAATQKFCGTCGKPRPAANGTVATTAPTQGGIVYDPA